MGATDTPFYGISCPCLAPFDVKSCRRNGAYDVVSALENGLYDVILKNSCIEKTIQYIRNPQKKER